MIMMMIIIALQTHRSVAIAQINDRDRVVALLTERLLCVVPSPNS